MADDPFPPKIRPTDTGVRDFSWSVFDPHPLSGLVASATIEVQVLQSDGTLDVRRFNLIDHLTVQERTVLQTMNTRLRSKMVTRWGAG